LDDSSSSDEEGDIVVEAVGPFFAFEAGDGADEEEKQEAMLMTGELVLDKNGELAILADAPAAEEEAEDDAGGEEEAPPAAAPAAQAAAGAQGRKRKRS
jgi:hypothetical protein